MHHTHALHRGCAAACSKYSIFNMLFMGQLVIAAACTAAPYAGDTDTATLYAHAIYAFGLTMSMKLLFFDADHVPTER